MIAADTAPRPHDRTDLGGGVRGRVRHLRILLAGCGALLVLATAVGWAARGPAGAAGAAAGVTLVVASYTASTLAIAWADAVNPRLVLPVGLGVYVTKFSLFGVMMIALTATDWAGLVPMAIGIVAAVVGWTGTQVWWTVRTVYPFGTHE